MGCCRWVSGDAGLPRSLSRGFESFSGVRNSARSSTSMNGHISIAFGPDMELAIMPFANPTFHCVLTRDPVPAVMFPSVRLDGEVVIVVPPLLRPERSRRALLTSKLRMMARMEAPRAIPSVVSGGGAKRPDGGGAREQAQAPFALLPAAHLRATRPTGSGRGGHVAGVLYPLAAVRS